ncbi:hypothetical protein S58_00650 [Bradyrhizobium oligotrophicum S58]|uniref:Uncharacterized protein n=1 Tax=Bradyrhizobium oligotrophicum S58 TaxID=1245469 RepID=M4Z0N8_9BRAD|nr:hypothetical protein [Bradyrhizobium oligotrophicum]BAM86086.1 hypothetical protein S58_00650 [Bradyrhizobium oligotrophicum S58]
MTAAAMPNMSVSMRPSRRRTSTATITRRLVLLMLAVAFPWTGASAQSLPPATPTAKAAPKTTGTKAKVAKTATAVRESGPCAVGVITALGDIFTVQKNGMTRLGDEYAEVPVSWGFDDLVYARVKAATGDTGVRRIAVPKGAFDPFYQSPPIKAENGKLTPIVRKVAGASGCASYLVVTRRTDSEPSVLDEVTGIGVINRGIGFGRYSHVFIMMDIQLYDGTTFEKREPATSSKALLSRLTSGVGPASHAGDVDNSAFPASPADAANNNVLRDMARSMLKFRLDQRLPAYFGRE